MIFNFQQFESLPETPAVSASAVLKIFGQCLKCRRFPIFQLSAVLKVFGPCLKTLAWVSVCSDFCQRVRFGFIQCFSSAFIYHSVVNPWNALSKSLKMRMAFFNPDISKTLITLG